MSIHEQDALDLYTPHIAASLQLSSALRGLLKHRVLTPTGQFEVMKQAAVDRQLKLLSLIRTRGRRAFRGFCEMLKDECLHELSYNLQKAAYVKTEELFV